MLIVELFIIQVVSNYNKLFKHILLLINKIFKPQKLNQTTSHLIFLFGPN